MRNVTNLNFKWAFTKQCKEVPTTLPEDWYWVNLPHTWNAIDGQDGNADYYRGDGWYVKKIEKIEIPEAEKQFIEILGANSSATLYVNGKEMASHDGGYSTWRVDVTDVLTELENIIAIKVNNAPNRTVYPQSADFTFYGGLYRDINLISLPASHFDVETLGTPGLHVTPSVLDGKWTVKVESFVKDTKEGQTLVTTIKKPCGCVVGRVENGVSDTVCNIDIEDGHLWNGVKDPYLYTAVVELKQGEEVLDCVSCKFGLRTFYCDPDKGFFLNGVFTPLRGVSRHQDRWALGNALSEKEHKEDIEYILEAGFNTIRLAHYQHDQKFYDLCDEAGLIIWAEIPYISKHMSTGRENTISQMKELVTQNYNHASIVCWGLSNEITMDGADDPDLIENHRILEDLVKSMDSTRFTTMAIVSSCPIDAEYINIPDVVSWNHYFGWYGGSVDMNGPWFDNFHAKWPNKAVGISEYGCEALNWHTSTPESGDYSEEYQAYYHEEMIKVIDARPWLWATHVWNMYDFGCDGRNEGGEPGQNHKGLMNFDRTYKKDSYYAYKAWLTDKPFVHLCSKKYVDRVEDVTKVKVYSNLPEVELYANGKLVEKKTGKWFFEFNVKNEGVTNLVAKAQECEDCSTIKKVDEPNPAYRMVEKGAILNWFDVTEIEGYLSINDRCCDIAAVEEAKGILKEALVGLGGESIVEMLTGPMGTWRLLRLFGLMGVMGIKPSKEQLLDLNAKLNKIHK